MTLRRSLPSLVMTAVLIVAAAVSLGVPDWRLASEYLYGKFPSAQAALAVASFVCWFMVAATAAVTVISSFRRATDAQVVQRRWTRATLFVTAGVIVLGMGVLHHSTTGYAMCCGSQPQHIVEAQKLVQSP